MKQATTIMQLALWGWLLIISPWAAAESGSANPTWSNPNQDRTLTNLGEPAPASLRQFIQSSLTEHPQMQAAKANLKAVRARLKAADRAVYNPELELDTEDTNIRSSTMQLSQKIDWGDQRGSRTSVAQAEFSKANAEYELAIQGLSRDLLVALANNDTQGKLASLVEDSLKLMQEFADVAEQRHKAGDLNQVELNLARLAYSETLTRHAQALAEAAAAKERLRALFRYLPNVLPALPESLPTPRLPSDIESWLSQLPAMRAQQAQVAASRYTVALRKSERAWDPTIALRGGKEDRESLVGLTLTIPLNVRNTFSAEVDAAQQDLIESEQSALQLYRDHRGRILASTEEFKLLQKAWDNWRTNGQTSVSRQLELIKRLWRAGDMSTAEYLVQLKQAIDTQAAGIELRGRSWKSGFNWLYETAQINTWLDINVTGKN